MTRPALSIIVPNHNYGRFLPRLAHALGTQTCGLDAVELILADDGSSDDSRQAVTAFEALPLARITALWLDHQGHPAPVRNAGFAQARGRLILCLDPDDIPGPGYLTTCLDALAARPETHLVYTDYTEVAGDATRQAVLHDFDPGLLRTQNILPPAAVIRRQVWEASKGYRANTTYEDWDFWIQAAAGGFGFARLPGVHFAHVIHGDNLSFAAKQDDARSKATLVIANGPFFSPPVRRWAAAVLKGESWANPGPRGVIPTRAVAEALLARNGALP
jgi:glycosyltransferase involved in cell wall biosynthesis